MYTPGCKGGHQTPYTLVVIARTISWHYSFIIIIFFTYCSPWFKSTFVIPWIAASVLTVFHLWLLLQNKIRLHKNKIQTSHRMVRMKKMLNPSIQKNKINPSTWRFLLSTLTFTLTEYTWSQHSCILIQHPHDNVYILKGTTKVSKVNT